MHSTFNMIIKTTELLPLDHNADSADLDKIMNSIFNDAILLEGSCASHDLMQQFYGSLVEQNNSVNKNHQSINFGLVLLFGLIVTHRISGKFAIRDIPT